MRYGGGQRWVGTKRAHLDPHLDLCFFFQKIRIKLNYDFMIGKPNTVRPSLKAIADHVKTTGHNIEWDHFDTLAKVKTDYHCKIKETYLF